MGRHRRSGAAPAAEDYAAGTDRRHRGDRRRRPVRTGLLGASAAVAVGAVAVASGLLPGGDTFTIGNAGTGERQVQSRQAPELTTQGGKTQTPADGGTSGKSAGTETRAGSGKRTGASTTPSAKASASASKSASPSAAPSTSAKPSPKPSPSKSTSKPKPAAPKPAAPKPAAPKPAAPKPVAAPTTAAPATKPAAPKPDPTTEAPVETSAAPATAAPSTADRTEAAEAEVLRLVNAERAQVGCTPVRADAQLAALAGAFSVDMAQRGFFGHTDPDGATPWARAEKAGISGLAGENIARGQADAAAVMDSWMNSDGHRANILNCEYTTLGVGVYFADGGPWWTQDFGR
ncbi:CAP domain-containing protein [Streptomyces sp. NPDC059352]|uniref:CAP domain-containing protein n=1 Tax=Streptomyces sp. NPDC059352 TaxID=3346810 RepID=UPI0036D05CA7